MQTLPSRLAISHSSLRHRFILTSSGTIVSPNFFTRTFLSSFALINNNNNNNMSTEIPLKVKLLSSNATFPTKGSELAAGFDLASAEDIVIRAGSREMVKTDVAVACPPGTYARVAPRSGLAKKNGIDVGAGVIDADYRGPIGVILFNFGELDFVIKKGDRIAQMILEKVCMAPAIEVIDLDDTERGAAGFGSTGVSAKKQRTVTPTNEALPGSTMPVDETNSN
jgi:dUTP pyrophosphatase